MPATTLDPLQRLHRDITHTWRRLCTARRDGNGQAACAELALLNKQLDELPRDQQATPST